MRSMFPNQQSNESWFVDPLIFEDDDKLLDELLADHVSSSGNNAANDASNEHTGGDATNVGNKNTKKRRGKSSTSIQENMDANGNHEIKNKKVVHREIERQRRQEMTKLCASLRGLLPLEFIKGKRSISDHMNEAVNYIKHMQTSIEELRTRRDKLLKASSSHEGTSTASSTTHAITLNPCRDGVEILISSSLEPEEFPLSRVLLELLDSGLNVVSCESTKANDMSFHRIQVEVSDLTAGVDLSMLQERLAKVINRA